MDLSNKKNCCRKHTMPDWANFLSMYNHCPPKTRIEKNNILAPNFNNQSAKMRYAQLVKSNGSHWTNNKLYREKRILILNSYYSQNKYKPVC